MKIILQGRASVYKVTILQLLLLRRQCQCGQFEAVLQVPHYLGRHDKPSCRKHLVSIVTAERTVLTYHIYLLGK